MKIKSIDVLSFDTGNRNWRPIGVRIHTENGLYGDGEASLAFGAASDGAFGMLLELSRLIIGMDAMDHEVIWNKLFHTTFWGQNGGPIVFSAISAIDTALWDIKGKALCLPIYKLLGGKLRDDLRCYASQLQFGWDTSFNVPKTIEQYAAVSRKAVADGYDAIKIDFLGFDENGRNLTDEDRTHLLTPRILHLASERLSAVREAVGENVDIIMENHSYTDAQAAIQLGRLAERYGVLYFEEPSTPTPQLTKYIRDNVNVPIAHGERIYSRWQFAPYFADASIQVIQPDIGTCGGITEVKKICDMGHTYDANVQLHVCGSPLATAAALQVEAALPNFLIHEHHVFCLHAYNIALCKYDYQPKNGRYAIPDLPGLGNEWSEQALRRCRRETI